MTAEVMTYGQLAAFGQGSHGKAVTVARVTAIIMSVIDHSRSLPPRSTAFQPACKIAAQITEARTSELMRSGSPAPRSQKLRTGRSEVSRSASSTIKGITHSAAEAPTAVAQDGPTWSPSQPSPTGTKALDPSVPE